MNTLSNENAPVATSQTSNENENETVFEIKKRRAIISATELDIIKTNYPEIEIVAWTESQPDTQFLLVPDSDDTGDNHLIFELPKTDDVLATKNADEFIIGAIQKAIKDAIAKRVSSDGEITPLHLDDVLPVKLRGLDVWAQYVSIVVDALKKAKVKGVSARSIRFAIESQETAEKHFHSLPSTIWDDKIIPNIKKALGDTCPIFDYWVSHRHETADTMKTKAAEPVDLQALDSF